MTRLRTMLTFAVVLLVLRACGDKPRAVDKESDWIKRTVPVRVLTTDLLRGGTAALYRDGRTIVSVMHLGGGTDWHGTWVEEDERLTIRLHRQQERTSEYSAPKDLDPPDELILVRTGEGAWSEERRTFVSFNDLRLPWSLLNVHRIPKVAIEKEFHFLTEDEFLARGGWEIVEDIDEREDVPEEPVAPKGRDK